MQHRPPGRIGESVEYGVQPFGLMFNHKV
jgi:hypothetical protein